MNIEEKEQLRRRQLLQKLLNEHFERNRQNLGKLLGYKDGAFVRQMLASNRAISEKTIAKIHSHPKFSGWFDQDSSATINVVDMPAKLSRIVSNKDEISMIDNPDYPAVRRVKLALSAGISGFAIEMEEESHAPLVFGKYWYQSRGYKPENLLAVRVKGASMEPGMGDSDTVVINTVDITPADGEVFAVNYEGEAVVKRLIRDAGEWWLSSDNPDQRRYARKLCAGDACIIIGRIVHKQSERI